jgi:hypothetical protein
MNLRSLLCITVTRRPVPAPERPGHAIESMWFQIHQFQNLDMAGRETNTRP